MLISCTHDISIMISCIRTRYTTLVKYAPHIMRNDLIERSICFFFYLQMYRHFAVTNGFMTYHHQQHHPHTPSAVLADAHPTSTTASAVYGGGAMAVGTPLKHSSFSPINDISNAVFKEAIQNTSC